MGKRQREAARRNRARWPRLTTSQKKRARFRAVWQADSGRCWYCRVECRRAGEPWDGRVPGTVDHIEPRATGGTNHRENLHVCCRICNQDKADMDLQDFLALDRGTLTGWRRDQAGWVRCHQIPLERHHKGKEDR